MDRDYPGAYGGGHDFSRHRMKRPVTDYGSTIVQYMRNRRRGRVGRCEQERPSPSYIVDMTPPLAHRANAADTVPAKHLHHSLNKVKHPIFLVKWTPEGRRLMTGSSSGEFTLWNGMGFNFETIMSAHDCAVRAAAWSHNDEWLVSADQDGIIKYWHPNFNNVGVFQGHEATIREVAFAPTDVKFVTASDDSTLKIWDFARRETDSTITGHGWDAKTVDWHPSKGLIVSGSKDHQVKLWDPRNGNCLTTLHGHKSPISKVSFEPSKGQCLATSARDPVARIFDLRMMREVLLLRGHEHEVTTMCWHPFHPDLLSTGSSDGSIHHYLLDEPNTPEGTALGLYPYDTPDPLNAPTQTIYPAHRVQYAHESHIWSLDWHPLGHIMASGSNDKVTRFWTRPRPGDEAALNDRYHIGQAAAAAAGYGQVSNWQNRGDDAQDTAQADEEPDDAEDEEDALVDQTMPARQLIAPGLQILSTVPDGSEPSSMGNMVSRLPGMGNAPPPSLNVPPVMSAVPIIQQEIPDANGNNLVPGNYAVPAALSEQQNPQPASLLNGAGLPPDEMNKLFEQFKQGHLLPPHVGQIHNGQPPSLGLSQGSYAHSQPPVVFPPKNENYGQPTMQSFSQQLHQPLVGIERPGSDGADAGAIRKRTPLPSQEDSLKQEQLRGKYRGLR